MSDGQGDAERPQDALHGTGRDGEEPPSPGPNLALIYSLLALALAAAIGFALMIVMPFHHRR